MDNYLMLSNKYNTFIYESYRVESTDDKTKITFHFRIPDLVDFFPSIELEKFESNKISDYLIFHIGLVELISYWKCTCSKTVIIRAGYLDNEQIEFFKKLYYYGLGELFYTNGIEVSYEDFMDIMIDAEAETLPIDTKPKKGNLIAIGGGKDSNVSLEILSSLYSDNHVFIINPKEVHLACAKAGGYEDDKVITINRILDKNMLDLNSKGFINGHTPFSALVAFVSFLTAYINNKRYIVLSNESSANESNVKGSKINHQYSKTYEFENDFNEYTKKYFKLDIKYFSLLRPLSEYQIGKLFSKYEKYHHLFKSCNVGSKQKPWDWCGNCPKCLFVYIILSPFLYKDKLIEIFGEDLFEKQELLDTFLMLTGYKDNKPFECVGTFYEVRYAISKLINSLDELPYLLKYYKDNFPLEDLSEALESKYNDVHNLDPQFEELLKMEIDKYVK